MPDLIWRLHFDHKADRSFKKLPGLVQRQILRYMRDRVIPSGNPESLGKALTGEFRTLWRYRVGDYRVICRIEKTQFIILMVAVGHRSSIYKHAP